MTPQQQQRKRAMTWLAAQSHPNAGTILAEIAALQQALSWALPHADDGVQAQFDLDRHGIVALNDECIRDAEKFNAAAKLVGFESKYHPRLKEQNDE